MKKHNGLALLVSLFIFSCANGQIRLKGYRCKYYENQSPNTMAEMYNKNDTFRFTLLSRDIWSEMGDEPQSKKSELQVGLKLCFHKKPYFRTKDSLYISTGRFAEAENYYYRVYMPSQQVSISVRSKFNDSLFSEKSKWLLSQIREHRKGDVYLINEKGQTCQVPDTDD